MATIAASSAVSSESVSPFSVPGAVVAAVHLEFEGFTGAPVRLSVYDSEENFLDVAATKLQALVNDDGVALLTVRGLEPGDYAFVAYLDEDRDGKLNRGSVLGRPKEPIAFSNGVVPKLRRPTFDETKVAVRDGSVVTITLPD